MPRSTRATPPPASLEPQTLFAPWAGARGILLAVSGGPDSMALLRLAAQWRQDDPRAPPLFAATVDHGLRTEAAEECALVAAAAQRLAIPHAVLHWSGPKPLAGLQEAARAARYGLLEDHATGLDADVIMTAHHSDDQAETVLFRLLRGSGVAGLAAMRAQTPRGAIFIARPLLALRKEQLIAFCEACGEGFADDRSNRDPRFARTQLRSLLKQLENSQLGAPDWSRLAQRLARAEDALIHYAAAARAKYARIAPDGTAEIDLRALATEPREIVLRVLTEILTQAGGSERLRLDRLETGLDRLEKAMEINAKTAFTLAGCHIRYGGGMHVLIAPEPPRHRGRPGK